MTRTEPTPEEKRRLDLLLPLLDGAVQLKILELSDFSDHDRAVLARKAVDRIAANGDALLYPIRGETAKAFAALVRGLSVLAFAPGGVTWPTEFPDYTRHWCTDHDVCTGKKPSPVAPSRSRRRRIVDVELPGGEVA